MKTIKLLVFVFIVSLITVTAEQKERALVQKQIEDVWAKSKTTELLNLIILNCNKRGEVFQSELNKIFFSISHLPDDLTPRKIYCTSEKCIRRVQYIGKIGRGNLRLRFFLDAAGETNCAYSSSNIRIY